MFNIDGCKNRTDSGYMIAIGGIQMVTAMPSIKMQPLSKRQLASRFARQLAPDNADYRFAAGERLTCNLNTPRVTAPAVARFLRTV